MRLFLDANVLFTAAHNPRGKAAAAHRSRQAVPVGHTFPPGLAQKDRPIFQAAGGCRATHLLTGDLKDFGPLMNRPEHTSGVHVLTVADFLAHLGRRQV